MRRTTLGPGPGIVGLRETFRNAALPNGAAPDANDWLYEPAQGFSPVLSLYTGRALISSIAPLRIPARRGFGSWPGLLYLEATSLSRADSLLR